MDDPPVDDPHRVDPAQHRGPGIGILARMFRLAGRRRDDDHRGPAPLPREDYQETER